MQSINLHNFSTRATRNLDQPAGYSGFMLEELLLWWLLLLWWWCFGTMLSFIASLVCFSRLFSLEWPSLLSLVVPLLLSLELLLMSVYCDPLRWLERSSFLLLLQCRSLCSLSNSFLFDRRGDWASLSSFTLLLRFSLEWWSRLRELRFLSSLLL